MGFENFELPEGTQILEGGFEANIDPKEEGIIF